MSSTLSDGNLVLAAAIGSRQEDVLPFLESLRASGYRGDIALFVNRDLARGLDQHPRAKGVVLEIVREWPPFRRGWLPRARIMRYVWSPLHWAAWIPYRLTAWLPRGRLRRRARAQLAPLASPPMDARFLLFHDYLARHVHRRVVMSDTRDVLFQSDPFETLPATGLSVSIESSAYTIATEPHNAFWLARAYGPRCLERIGDKPVSCVGVTAGERASALHYLEQLGDQLCRLSPSRAGIGGADTAAHNYLLWTGQLGEVHEMRTLVSPIATLNGLAPQDIDQSSQGRVRNLDGSEPSIVHQYDRVPGLRDDLRRALCGK